MTRTHRVWVTMLAVSAVCGTLALATIDRMQAPHGPDVACQILPNGIVHPLESARRGCPLARYDRVARLRVGSGWAYVESHEGLRRAAAASGATAIVEVVRDGEPRQVEIPVLADARAGSVGDLLAAAALALVMLAVALVVLWSSSAAAVLPFVVLYSSASVLLTVSLCGVSGRLGLAAACAWAATAASLAHLAMAFPRPRKLLQVAPKAALLPYVVAALLGGSAAISLVRFPGLWILTDRMLVAASALAWGLVALGCGGAIRESSSTLARARARVMLLGTLLVPLVPVLGTALLGAGGHHEAVSLSILAASLSLLPIGYSILRYDLFDVAQHVRNGIAALLLAAAVAAMVTVTGLLLTEGLGFDAPIGEPGLLFTLIFASVLVAEILRVRLRAVVQRWTRPGSRRLALLAQEHAQQAGAALDAHCCLQETLVVLRQGLDCEGLAAFLPGLEGWYLAAGSSPAAPVDPMLASEAARIVDTGGLVHLAREERPDASPWGLLARAGVEVVAPLRCSDQLVGLLLVSASARRLPYDTTELSFLRAVSAQAALAVRTARLTQELVAAERFAAAGRVSANLAHELGKPLGVIERLAELLPGHLGDGARLTRKARTITATARELRGIVRAVLQAPPAAASSGADGMAVSAAAVVERAVSAAARVHGHGRVAVVASTAARLAAFDDVRIERALVNLLDNALRAEPSAGVVTACVGDADGFVHIMIEDHGCGMSAEVRARAFEPFFTTRSREGGTGLGLSFSREVIDGAGGSLEVWSAPGRGTRVEVSLPALSRAETHAA